MLGLLVKIRDPSNFCTRLAKFISAQASAAGAKTSVVA
jgi:hypothetical protein